MGELVTVQVRDGISRSFAADTGARVAAVVGGADALVEALRVRVGLVGAATVLAQVNAEVDGRRIRVQEVAGDLGEALERVTEGLRSRITAVAGGWVPRPWPRRPRGRVPAGAQSAAVPAGRPVASPPPRVADAPAADPVRTPDGLDRPAGSGLRAAPEELRARLSYATELPRIVRRKCAHLVWCSPDSAARTMDAMDYDIHLFTDPATETDAVVYRVGPTGYRLARTRAAAPPSQTSVPMTLSPCGAPELTEPQAIERLVAAELPFLFFAPPGDGRGQVLYRRFDGRLGLIAAAS
ncbi:sigma 54 modulation/S30EA ribosomal C-terminal domain-containing protein [Kitasatospora sp. NPDC004240]